MRLYQEPIMTFTRKRKSTLSGQHHYGLLVIYIIIVFYSISKLCIGAILPSYTVLTHCMHTIKSYHIISQSKGLHDGEWEDKRQVSSDDIVRH